MSDRSAPSREIGIVGIILIATNGMIGTGIFALPGKLDAAVGSFAPLLLVLAGLGMSCVALSFADCARHFDRSGGPLLYVSTAFGRMPGFVTGWLAYIARVASIAANATILATTAATFYPSAASPVVRAIIIVTLFVTLMAINVAGTRRAVTALAAITTFKLIPLVILAIMALLTLGGGPSPVVPPLSGIESVALVAIYAFTAFETATVPAAETRDPRRTIPVAMVGTVLAITALYATVQWAYGGADLPNSETPLVDLARAVGGPVAAVAMALTVLVSIVGNQSSALLGHSRLTVGMAEEGMIPARFGTMSTRFGTPAFSIIFFGVAAMLLALSGTFLLLAVVSALARLFVYLACILAAPRLDGEFGASRAWPRRWLAPAVGAVLCLWAMTQAKPAEWRGLVLLSSVGALLFLLASANRRRAAR